MLKYGEHCSRDPLCSDVSPVNLSGSGISVFELYNGTGHAKNVCDTALVTLVNQVLSSPRHGRSFPRKHPCTDDAVCFLFSPATSMKMVK